MGRRGSELEGCGGVGSGVSVVWERGNSRFSRLSKSVVPGDVEPLIGNMFVLLVPCRRGSVWGGGGGGEVRRSWIITRCVD